MSLSQLKEDFAKALREQYIEDGHGNPVRTKHSARIKKDGEQRYLWADIRSAPRQHMQIAFQQRREQIVGYCRQLSRDVDYYNELNPGDAAIQLVFDFTEDVEEGQYSSEFQMNAKDQQTHDELREYALVQENAKLRAILQRVLDANISHGNPHPKALRCELCAIREKIREVLG